MNKCLLENVDSSTKIRGINTNGVEQGCFICGGNIVSRCRCPRADSVCENGHNSHYCYEKKEWHEGHSNHGSNICCALGEKTTESNIITTAQIKTGIKPVMNLTPKYNIEDVMTSKVTGEIFKIKEIFNIIGVNYQRIEYSVERWEPPYFEDYSERISEEDLETMDKFAEIANKVEKDTMISRGQIVNQ